MIMPFRTQNLTKHLIRENQRQIIGWISVLAHQPVISQYLKSKKEIYNWVDIRYYNYCRFKPYKFHDDKSETMRAMLESENK